MISERHTDPPRDGATYAVPLQVVWAVLSAIWNAAGVALIARGLRAPGPTASLAGALVLLAMAVAFATTVRRWPVAYVLASIVGGLAAIGAVVGAFTADPALWPSDFWRYAGVILNGVGLLAALVGIRAVVTLSTTGPSARRSSSRGSRAGR